jgi:hypothetical protein
MFELINTRVNIIYKKTRRQNNPTASSKQLK